MGPDWEEAEVLIRCAEISEKILTVQKMLSDFGSDTKSLVLSKGETEYFVPLEQILFFETEGKNVIAHTAEKMYEAQYRLYELEEILPRYFMRISKSAIVNSTNMSNVFGRVSFYGTDTAIGEDKVLVCGDVVFGEVHIHYV